VHAADGCTNNLWNRSQTLSAVLVPLCMGFAIAMLTWYAWTLRKEVKSLKAKSSGD
jgi:hypothetical protein